MNKEDPTEKFLIPLGYRLLVRLDKVGATVIKTVTRETDGQEVDIHAPEKHREESRLGTVLAIGHKCEKHWRTGDRILEIDGKSVEGANLEEVVKMLRGEPGTSVEISIDNGDGARTVTLARAKLL